MAKNEIKKTKNVKYHTHSGTDSPRLTPTNAFNGFPVLATAPTYTGRQGEMVFVDDQSSVRRLYVFMFGSWRFVNLT